MPKILIEYDQDIVVLMHILRDLRGPEVTDMIANLLIERMYPNG